MKVIKYVKPKKNYIRGEYQQKRMEDENRLYKQLCDKGLVSYRVNAPMDVKLAIRVYGASCCRIKLNDTKQNLEITLGAGDRDHGISFVAGDDFGNTTYRDRLGQFVAVWCNTHKCLNISDILHRERDECFTIFHELIERHRGDLQAWLSKTDEEAEGCPPVSVMLGADPEFEVIQDGEIVSADGIDLFSEDTDSEIGIDGAGYVAELRPEPSETAEGIIANLEYLIGKVRREGYGLSVEGDLKAIGSHIHIGVGETFTPPLDLLYLYNRYFKRLFYSVNGKARDNYRDARPIEEKPYGFEYRLLPAGVLLDKEIATLVFRGFKHLTEYYLNGNTISCSEYGVGAKREYLSYVGWTAQELAKVKNFVAHWQDVKSTDLIAAWRREVPVETPMSHIIVNKDDEFDPHFVESVEAELERREAYIKIFFYGLSESRGESTSGVNIVGYDTIQHPETIQREIDMMGRKKYLAIGVPFCRRAIGTQRLEIDLFVELVVNKAIIIASLSY